MKTIYLKSLLALVVSLFLFTLMPGEAVAAAQCSGLNQKSCWHINPKKWCNPGLQYVGNGKPGGGRCVRPRPKPAPTCGGLDQKSCWNVNPKKWCQPGLDYAGTGKPGDGKCIRPGSDYDKSCGGLNQSSCWNANPAKWCDDGLRYVGNGKPGGGRCIAPGMDRDPDCGGLDQKSCWSVNPANWCDKDYEYYGTGKPSERRCIAPGSDPTPDCGRENQKSCWNPNPKFWCDDGMSYSPGVIPGEGTCNRKYTKEDYIAAAEDMMDRYHAVRIDNPLARLRTCLLIPDNLAQLQDVMAKHSENGINRILQICRVSPDDLKDYGAAVLGEAPRTLEIGLSGGLVAGVGVEGSISYAIPLEPKPDGRYFLTNGIGGGAGAAAGVDVTVGLTQDVMPTEHWAAEKGRSVNFSGKLLGSVSVSIDFPEQGVAPTGLTIGGGVGIGAEVGTLIFTRDQYLYNF